MPKNTPSFQVIPKSKQPQNEVASQSEFDTWLYPLPNLESPIEFNNWRQKCIDEFQIPRGILAQTLAEQGSLIALIRAALVLVHSDQRERAIQLASQGLATSDKTIFLFAKLLCAILKSNTAFVNSSIPKLTADSVAVVLEGILKDLSACQRSMLSIEVEVRTRHALAESYILLSRLDDARLQAAEVAVLAPGIGLEIFALNATYQLATISYYQGNSALAEQSFRYIETNSSSSLILIERATYSRAVALQDLGDDTGSLACLGALQSESRSESFWQGECLKFLTLRYNWQHADSQDYFLQATNFIAILTSFYQEIISSQLIPVDQTSKINFYYSKARVHLLKVQPTTIGWMKAYCNVLEAFTYYKLKKFSLAKNIFPSKNEISELPTYYQIFAYSLLAEILFHRLPATTLEMRQCLDYLLEIFNVIEDRICMQVTRKIQLLFPFTLSMLGHMPNVPSSVITLARHAIFNFKGAFPHVYESDEIRPIQAASLVLKFFGFSTDHFNRPGGGQTAAMRASLYNEYFERKAWFFPVPPAAISFAFMCLAQKAEQPYLAEEFEAIAHSVRKDFGTIPKINKLADEIQEITLIEKSINALFSGRINVDDFSHQLYQNRSDNKW
jgi:hypothetical protein